MKRNIIIVFGLAVMLLMGLVLNGWAESGVKVLKAMQQAAMPVIDGIAEDEIWSQAPELTIVDAATGKKISLRAVYDKSHVSFLVSYPDSQENRLHKPWVWDKELELYDLGPQREDVFVFKWNMQAERVDLSNFSNDLYVADVWYWKANRTDPAGYSDDKTHILSDQSGKKAKQLISHGGYQRYLMRVGDEGTSAQKKRILTDFQGDVVDQYVTRQPSNSRADVRAKGNWENGTWTVEFSRLLDTGHQDDVRFDPFSKQGYLFGVSMLGLYAEPIKEGETPGYGKGRISEPLYLEF